MESPHRGRTCNVKNNRKVKECFPPPFALCMHESPALHEMHHPLSGGDILYRYDGLYGESAGKWYLLRFSCIKGYGFRELKYLKGRDMCVI